MSNSQQEDDNHSLSSSSSSSSDEEYLTLNNANGRDRESLVRQKLLENFYGKSAVAAARPAVDSAISEDDDDDDDLLDDSFLKNGGTYRKDDLDSPHFDAVQHTQRHIINSNYHNLLHTEEQLALQVRTLDSTMQTLVYENYARFIDATDAIRSIGVHVTAHQPALLQQLPQAMDRLDQVGRATEAAVGPLRDQVAEKIRIQRLLRRLDALLQLPETLTNLVQQQHYIHCVQSFVNAQAILAKHSPGFTSLQQIETDCQHILQQLSAQLNRQVLHWNGQWVDESSFNNHEQSRSDSILFPQEQQQQALDTPALRAADSFEDDDFPRPVATEDNGMGVVVAPPRNMKDIFESIGALHILVQPETRGLLTATDETSTPEKEDSDAPAQSESQPPTVLSSHELQSLALGAATRTLDRQLDAHMIQVQERRFGGDPAIADMTDPLETSLREMDGTVTNTSTANGANAATTNKAGENGGSALIPHEYLSAMLEVATLFQKHFGNGTQGQELLQEFLTDAFGTFLAHVKTVLLEESSAAEVTIHSDYAADGADFPHPDVASLSNNNENPSKNSASLEPDDNVEAEEHISQALVFLIQAVREMATALEGGNAMIDQAAKLVDSMVTRRVHQKFGDLRMNIAQSCLIPFCERLAAAPEESNGEDAKDASPDMVEENSVTDIKVDLTQARLIASSTLSDCLQLVDDTIRSIVLAGTGENSTATNSQPIVKEAVRESIRQLTDWLAGSLEVLAGGESSISPQGLVDVPKDNTDLEDEENVATEKEEDLATDGTPITSSSGEHDNLGQVQDIMDLVESARGILTSNKENHATENEYVVVIADMCRLAQNSVSDNLEQSLSTNLGTGRRKANVMFGGEAPNSSTMGRALKQSEDDEVSRRFKLAASRIFAIYALEKGAFMADLLCSNMERLASETVAFDAPREQVWKALGVVKELALECAEIFDSPSHAGPVPDLEEGPVIGGIGNSGLNLGAMKTSLQLDVERMFKEKLAILLHPSENMDFSRSAFLFLMLKVAFREWFEAIRMEAFSVDGYKQMLVDIEFLKLMIPHYIDEEYSVDNNQASTSLMNLLSDILEAVGEQRFEDSYESDEDLLLSCKSVLRSFMDRVTQEGNDIGKQFILEADVIDQEGKDS